MIKLKGKLKLVDASNSTPWTDKEKEAFKNTKFEVVE